MNKTLSKVLKTVLPLAALATSFAADWWAEKEKDEKYVSREELDKLLKDKEESE